MHFSGKLHECFKILAHDQPSAPAVITNDSVLTYAELDAAADTLALELHARGIVTGEAIGVLVERSADLPAAFLAILKTGGVYVPMVADLPADRLVNIAQQAGIRRLIVLDGIEPPAALVDTLIGNGNTDASEAVIRPETLTADRHGQAPPSDQTAEMTDLAAILFTSGSTGMPKGVMIRHEACVNMALGHIAAHEIRREDRILLSTSPGFILGFRELCLPFMSGAAFVPVSRSTIDYPDRLLALMGRHRVSFAMFTPSYLRLLNGAVPQGLRCIVTAGERPNVDDARHYARHVDYWNVHGATEVCGTICMHRVDPDGEGPIPSGRPFANTAVHLLDEGGNDVPKGEVGEVHVVGVGVSRGYLKQPQLTAQYFIETRYGRAFRTHDLARWNANGELETVGRADDVVKVSGQSVSLGEIERTLLCHPGVRRVAAMQHKGLLVACVECPDPDRAQGVDWREFLGRVLPSYMIPAQVAVLARMPINSAGKVDRKALLEIADSIFEGARELETGTPPQGDLERAIAGIWEDVLGMRPILRENNFFAVGGTSLMAIAVSQRLQVLGHNVPVQMVLTALTVEALAARIAAMQEQPTGMSDAAPAENIATADQEGFWIASEIGLAPSASHIVRVLSVRGRAPQPDAWQSAWTRLIDRHAALRTAFYSDGNGPLRWRTVESHELPPHAHFSFDRCASIEAARDIVARWSNERFRLTEPPLFRAGLIEVDEGNEILFWFVLHHSVVDGMSARLIQDDLLALLGGRPLPPAPNGIAIASRAEQQYLVSDRAARDREFWRSRLDALVGRGSEAFDEYVTERPRPALPSGRGAPPLAERLDAGTVEALGRLAKAHGTGLHALLLAILAAEIRRRGGGLGDVIVGSGISLRPAGGETAIGHFVNVLPVVLMREGDAPFSSLLRLSQSALTETVEHAAYPAGLLYREFRQRHPELRARSRTSLFDIALTGILPRTCVDQETGLTLEPRPLPGELEHPAAGLDLSFSHEPCPEAGGGLNLLLTWNPDVCSKNTAVAWLSTFAAWARWLVEEPGRIERPLPALLPHETALLEQWERGPNLPCQKRRSHEVFEELADRQPHRPAIVSHEYVKTFAQLDARANGIAHRLMHQGVVRGTMVAVLTSGSADLPATVLGIWKAGGVYVPLAYEIPAARLAAMSRDAGADVLVVLDGLMAPGPLADSVKAIIRPEECAPSDRRPRSEGSPEDVAYIVYTSGTTGMPKGVPIAHAGYVNIILGFAETIGLRPDDRMSLVATVGFDASLWELGNGLINGIALVPVSQALRDDPWLLKRYYRELGVTIAFHTPSYLRISEQIPFEGLRILLTGGEAPNHRDVQHHANQLAFWNFYGPTEATIVASGGRILSDHDPEVPLTVGRPLPNVRISLRRKDGSPVPPGVQGELCLGGIGIARGYLNRPDLSALSFVTTPEGRFYRSGDYGRWTADGQIEIIGRIDRQVKLNGQRVELGEIEQTLCAHPAVADAVVLVDELATGVKALRAFIRPRDATPSAAALAAFLSERLPAHMIPAGITPVAVIPLNPSGKVDREALLECAKQQFETFFREAPQDQLEMCIASIWADVLGVTVARNDNFFALGGNSLLAVTLAHRVSENLGLQVSARSVFASPTLAAFVGRIASRPAVQEPAGIIPETDIATEGEREFWTAEAAGLDTRTFNIPVHYLVIGDVAPARWQIAWSTLVTRHEGLRTFFEEDETGRLRRRIAPTLEVALEFAVAPDRTAALAHIRHRQADPLPMGVATLWRAGLVEAQEDGERFFWLALHHAVGDGQSVGTLFDELTILLADGTLPTPGGNGRVFASREQSYLAETDATKDAEYWIDLLKGAPAAAFDEWPLDRARSSRTPSGNHRLEVLLDPRTTEGLKALARSHESSLHALMLALLVMEARRRTGRTDVLVGTTASVRELASDARIVGYSVNMLPLHLRPAEKQCFGDLLRATQRSLAEALQHARYPFARIYRAFWSERPGMRQPLRYPLFDIAVTENPGTGHNDAPQRFTRATMDTGSVSYEYTNASPGQDMVLIHAILDEAHLLLQLHVNAAIYSAETARNWFEALAGWARWLAEDPARAEQPLPRLLPEEEERLAGWERGDTSDRPRLRFHELFEAVVDRPAQADCPAVITPKGVVSYRALEEEANAIAHSLVRRGVGRGSIVGVLTKRSPHLPAAALGVWKTGATYLPLDSDLPRERLAFMTRDAGVSQLIALDGVAVPEPLIGELPDALRPEDLSEVFRQEHKERAITTGESDDVAYILYTSGSTGEPKGTLISHDSYVNMLLGAAGIFGLTPDDRCLMFASPSFDVSLSDMGVPLTCGAALCPAPYEVVESPNRFLDFLRNLCVTVVDITPTYLRLFDGAELPPSVRVLVTGGEPPVPADVKTYATMLNYFNAYGPTETTITSTMGILKGDELGFMSAGRPLPNTSAHICDLQGNPLPPGVLGEIWLGGAGLSQGYLNRPELTAASFAETPRGRRYRTGDLGRWRMDGTIEIVGRIDDQVKLSGIRIELGEIEHALASHPAISQAVALLVKKDGGSKSLWAVVRLSPEQRMPAEDDWRAHLTERLPSHMIPSGVIPVPVIPLMASGKVDRSALLALLADRPSPSGLTPPKDDLERCVADVWKAVLEHSPIHREDNFFALGGHSLLAITVAHRLEKLLGREVPARELFAEPTLAGFAERLRNAHTSEEPAVDASSDLATVGQREFWTAEQAGLDTSGFNIPLTLAVHGDVPSAERWRATWSDLILRHDALRTGFGEDESGVLRRVVVTQLDVNLEIQAASSTDEAQAYIRVRQSEPFSMGVPGLWRAGLTQVEDGGQTIFWFVMHHAIGDGLSLGIIIEELTALLRGNALAPKAGSFNRTAAREIAYLDSETAQADAAYWQLIVGGLIERAPDALDEWPLDMPRPNARTATSRKGGHCFRSRLNKTTADGLRTLAKRNGATLHALMLAILGIEVRRRTGRSEFLLGTAASTRQSAAEARTVGYYINMLPLSCRVGEAESIDTSVRAMQQRLAEALQHSRFPFARIYGDFRREHPQATHPARYPLFDIGVTENPALGFSPETGLRFTGIVAPELGEVIYELRRNVPAQDMVLVHEGQQNGGLVLTLFVNAAIYTRDIAGIWFDSLVGWMQFLADNLHNEGKQLPLLLPEEEQLLEDWQNGPHRPLPTTSFPELFRRLAETHPECSALITAAAVQSFATVNTRADALAHALLDLNVKRGEPVAVLTQRSAALPETVLAIWKAGGCYLPLTADLPAERLAFMARDAGIRILIVLDGLPLLPELGTDPYTILRPEELPAGTIKLPVVGNAITPDDPAYIIYTSGSTGVPKGVVLRHGGMLNLGLGGAEILGIGSDDRILMISSPSFDLWISDLVTAWSVGAAVVTVSREAMNDISGMHALIQRLGVTVATMSPSYLRLFERADLPGLRILMTVGEPPIPEDARHYAADLSYFNGYGPTENTAATAIGHIRADAEQITVGRPLSNTSVYILDDSGKPVPPGVIGEVRLGGMGLAAGYLNRPELTAASFVNTADERRYRTGDLGRWLRSGELQILGRLDNQVKLRGQRVELGEIEHRLASYPGVLQAVAVVETLADQTQTLRSFVTIDSQAAAPTQAEWSTYLSESLPSYMIPSTILRVATIPLTAAGKVDRQALLGTMDADGGCAASALSEVEGHALRTPPQNAIEKRIAEVWAEQLGRPIVAREDNFFELGGNSLRAIAAISRLRREFECRVNDLYEHPVLADFARICRPRPDHLRAMVGALCAAWEGGRGVHAGSEAEREEALRMPRTVYETKIRSALERDLEARRPYRHVLLTGATGYLGSYLLRELLADRKIKVTVLVRGANDRSARARLGQVLADYFGAKMGTALRNSKRLNVLAGDLRHAELLLSSRDYGQLAETVDAIYHCAANVNHFGHYRDFYADNVAATRHLLSLAVRLKPAPADFHFVSTLSVAGSATPAEFRLFTEYDLAPEAPDDNYYVRTKQEAERLVIASRGELANACIHRIGNISFSTDSACLQRNIAENAFFRQIIAFIRLGAVPVELYASLCYVDVVARALIALASAGTLTNEIHHIETARQDRLADFIRTADAMADRVRACDFGAFLKRLQDAIDEPEMESAIAETVETFGLQSGRSRLARLHRLTVAADRTQVLLEKLGVAWPAMPPAGQNAMLRAAMKAISHENQSM